MNVIGVVNRMVERYELHNAKGHCQHTRHQRTDHLLEKTENKTRTIQYLNDKQTLDERASFPITNVSLYFRVYLVISTLVLFTS